VPTAPPTSDRPLIVVANRLPVTRGPDGWQPAAGGLVTALRPVIEQTGGAWIGWDDDADGVPDHVDGLACDLHPVTLTRAQVRGYYHGFANRTLWPLCHDLVAEPVIDRRWWRAYEQVNTRFADRVVDVVGAADDAGPAPLVWIHDYHLLRVPALVRARAPRLDIGFFLHIPFPPPELLARLPWRAQLLDGMLGADSIGFHIPRYRDNFLHAVEQLRPDARVDGHEVTGPDGHVTRVAAHPISIDTEEFATLAVDPDTDRELEELRAQFADRQVLLGVDRLDYTKGIRHRLQSIEHLLAADEDLRTRFAFIQIAVPSRDDVREYRELREQVETEVGRINGRFTDPGHDVPVHYLYRGVSRTALAAYYRLADVMCVTPLKDGMNLVAKEFVTVQDAVDGTGVLLLSEFCGTANEFGDAPVCCNPFDVEGQSQLMAQALELDADDRRARIRRMADVVRAADVYRWVDQELTGIRATTQRAGLRDGS
jgi:trehalose 6-phosphate synthase